MSQPPKRKATVTPAVRVPDPDNPRNDREQQAQEGPDLRGHAPPPTIQEAERPSLLPHDIAPDVGRHSSWGNSGACTGIRTCIATLEERYDRCREPNPHNRREQQYGQHSPATHNRR